MAWSAAPLDNRKDRMLRVGQHWYSEDRYAYSHVSPLDSQDVVALQGRVSIAKGHISETSYLKRGSLRGAGLAGHPLVTIDDEVWHGRHSRSSTGLDPNFRSGDRECTGEEERREDEQGRQ